MSEIKQTFKVGNRVKFVGGGAYGFTRKNGRYEEVHIGDILTISAFEMSTYLQVESSSSGRYQVYGFVEDVLDPRAHWCNVEHHFELTSPNWKRILGGKKK